MSTCVEVDTMLLKIAHLSKMTSPAAYRNHAFTTAKSAWKITEKAAVGIARWATTDHTGTLKMLAERPSMKALDAIAMGMVNLLAYVVGAVASAVLFVLLFTYGLPLLLFM